MSMTDGLQQECIGQQQPKINIGYIYWLIDSIERVENSGSRSTDQSVELFWLWRLHLTNFYRYMLFVLSSSYYTPARCCSLVYWKTSARFSYRPGIGASIWFSFVSFPQYFLLCFIWEVPEFVHLKAFLQTHVGCCAYKRWGCSLGSSDICHESVIEEQCCCCDVPHSVIVSSFTPQTVSQCCAGWCLHDDRK